MSRARWNRVNVAGYMTYARVVTGRGTRNSPRSSQWVVLRSSAPVQGASYKKIYIDRL